MIIHPIHYLFLFAKPEILRRITKLKLNFNLLTPDRKSIFNFLFDDHNKVILADFIEFINYNNLSIFEINNKIPLISIILCCVYRNSSSSEQMKWYEFIFNNNKTLIITPDKNKRYIPLHLIIFGFHIDVIKKIINEVEFNINMPSVPSGSTPLNYLCAKKVMTEYDINKIRLLVDNGATLDAKNIHGITPFSLLYKNIPPNIVLEFLRKTDYKTIIADNPDLPFVFIRNKCSIDEFKELFTLGANQHVKDENDLTLLTYVAYCDLLPHIKYLLELGLDINRMKIEPFYATPLHIIFMFGSEEIINYVINTCDDVLGKNATDYIGYPYEYLTYNEKLADDIKIDIYNKLFEKIKNNNYKNKSLLWYLHFMKYRIPKKLTNYFYSTDLIISNLCKLNLN